MSSLMLNKKLIALEEVKRCISLVEHNDQTMDLDNVWLKIFISGIITNCACMLQTIMLSNASVMNFIHRTIDICKINSTKTCESLIAKDEIQPKIISILFDEVCHLATIFDGTLYHTFKLHRSFNRIHVTGKHMSYEDVENIVTSILQTCCNIAHIAKISVADEVKFDKYYLYKNESLYEQPQKTFIIMEKNAERVTSFIRVIDQMLVIITNFGLN
jgi:hypothetical protein